MEQGSVPSRRQGSVPSRRCSSSDSNHVINPSKGPVLVKEGSYLMSDARARSRKAACGRQAHRQMSRQPHDQGLLTPCTHGQSAEHHSAEGTPARPSLARKRCTREVPLSSSSAAPGLKTHVSRDGFLQDDQSTLKDSAALAQKCTEVRRSYSVPLRFASYIPHPLEVRTQQAGLPFKAPPQARLPSQIPRRVPRPARAPTELSASFEAELKDLADDAEVAEMVQQHLHSARARRVEWLGTAARRDSHVPRLCSVLQTGGDCTTEHGGNTLATHITHQNTSPSADRSGPCALQQRQGAGAQPTEVASNKAGRHGKSASAGMSTDGGGLCRRVVAETGEASHKVETIGCAAHERTGHTRTHYRSVGEAPSLHQNMAASTAGRNAIGRGSLEGKRESSPALFAAEHCNRGRQPACERPAYTDCKSKHVINGRGVANGRFRNPGYAGACAGGHKRAGRSHHAKGLLRAKFSDLGCAKPDVSQRRRLAGDAAEAMCHGDMAAEADAALRSLARLGACALQRRNRLASSDRRGSFAEAAESSSTHADQVCSVTAAGTCRRLMCSACSVC
jgi:hypothetical protein